MTLHAETLERVFGQNGTLSPVEAEQLLTPAEVGRLFGVSPKTVTNWANKGRLGYQRTLGGHRRFRASVVLAEAAARDVPLMAPDPD